MQSKDHIQSRTRREKRGREVMRGESNGGKVVGKLCEKFVVSFEVGHQWLTVFRAAF